MQISVPGHLLLRAAKENWGRTCTIGPLGRHHHKPGKQQRHKTNQNTQNQKIKPEQAKIRHTRMTGTQFIGGFMQVMAALCHQILVWPKKQENKQSKQGKTDTHKPYTQVREATQHHAETRDPPARIPEITWRKPNDIGTHPFHFEANNDKAAWQQEW